MILPVNKKTTRQWVVFLLQNRIIKLRQQQSFLPHSSHCECSQAIPTQTRQAASHLAAPFSVLPVRHQGRCAKAPFSPTGALRLPGRGNLRAKIEFSAPLARRAPALKVPGSS